MVWIKGLITIFLSFLSLSHTVVWLARDHSIALPTVTLVQKAPLHNSVTNKWFSFMIYCRQVSPFQIRKNIQTDRKHIFCPQAWPCFPFHLIFKTHKKFTNLYTDWSLQVLFQSIKWWQGSQLSNGWWIYWYVIVKVVICSDDGSYSEVKSNAQNLHVPKWIKITKEGKMSEQL